MKIRAGWVVAPASLIPVLFAKPGLARHQGKSYVLEPVYFSASPAQITAMSVGELEIAALGFSSFPFAVQNAGLTDLRIIADEIQDGGKDNFSTHYMVKKDSGIATVADLKGKVLATNGVGTGVHMAMRAMLQRSGLQDKRDYTRDRGAVPDHEGGAATARPTDRVDHAVRVRSSCRPRRACCSQRDAMGTSGCRSGPRARASSAEPRGHGRSAGGFAARRALVPRSRQPGGGDRHPCPVPQATAGTVRGWIFTRNDFYRDPNGLVNLDALQSNIDLMRQLGIINAELGPQARQPRSRRRSDAAEVTRSDKTVADRRCGLVNSVGYKACTQRCDIHRVTGTGAIG